MGQPLPISRIMHTGVLLQCELDTTIADAAARMSETSVSSILITDGGTVVGIWTEHDALAIDFTDPETFRQPVSTVMSSPVLSLPETLDAGEAAVRLRDTGKRHFLVTNSSGKPVGILSQTDLALNQGLEPYLRLREVRAAVPRPPLVVRGDQSLAEVASYMHRHHADAVVVDCDEEGLGILTERDMVRFIARHTSNTLVNELATRPLLTVNEEDPLIHARDLLIDHRIRHLAVVNQLGEVTGLIGYHDMLTGAEQMYLDDLREALEQRDQALAKSRRTLQLAERVIESSFEGIMVTDKDVCIEFVNPAFTQLTGYTAEEVIGRSPDLLSSGRHDSEFYRRMWNSLETHGYWRGEIWNRRKTGELYLELLTITAITDDDGNTTHYAGLFTDITQNRRNEEQIRQLAYYDALTGVPNRRLLEDRLEHAIRHAHRKEMLLAVMFMDLDRFKEVNDTLGHAVGDDLLLQFTTRVKDCLREDDTLARLGGDEFIVLLPEMERLSDVFAVADRLIEANKRPYQINGNQINVGSSIGISLYPEDGTTVQELINGADIAMYRAKREGRNRYKLFAPHTVESA
ncbi:MULTISPECIES: diguanylate cyclase domain-containing protein [Marinobacter]|uniref:Diguanylate cyclase/phosphodiesterase (GGDEF & EAL domains) with PAS/PAC sensor(S) n=4 Tax=Marinobacter TaxID=2742 RepID=A0A833JML5_MARNT|nr:diguanylate cyclase [Marinobacter nauticus]KAE8544348.1 diguanylate cyclase/phosphodiesterase (GGDEF & EAL domains) with PAS/PAC sensor(s) [Marinobacter nauticus]MAL32634.1 diguanylate cyclase [Marinobacter sp.]MEC8823748.1 diguanylate cyclase [Pseudomonadota bacterium]MEC9082761.1 diguanylate cyclase [Pseudomonadota bacterium]